ncbi:MAG: molybdopterin-guanine dinucleotide biosynthesis protein B [Gemmatimonadota bacterium]|nr:molybdopterin-guanine dinucleotide biosynthesis protein B [Gemmatimonadota bacterium]
MKVLGFVGTSGSGKTTVIEQVVARLADTGLRVGVLKHARHGFDMDRPGKDSYRVREAGAAQVLVASRERWVLLGEQPDPLEEPSLEQMLRRFDAGTLDLVLVEGFSHAEYPKIEVYRTAHGKPPRCWPHDPDVIAVATDTPLEGGTVPRLDVNDSLEVTRFVLNYLALPAVLSAAVEIR